METSAKTNENMEDVFEWVALQIINTNIENIKDSNASDVLVYDCLELPNTILSPDEFRYVLTQIRKESISETIDFESVEDVFL